MWLTIITVVFLLIYAALIFFYFVQWNKLQDYKPAAQTPAVFVSVIVAARNEEKTLPLLLKDLSEQTFPQHLFEVIVVDDYSTDNTAAVASKFKAQNIRIIFPDAPPGASSKKAAIASGIKKTKGELMLITDADCRVSKEWLQIMASFYKERSAAFIAAPVAFTHDNSLLQIFQVLDFITLQGVTAASVNANVHTMCNGANLAYTKQAFEEVNGFAGIDKVATGDDMLLMHKIWKAYPQKVCYLKCKEAVVETTPMQSWKDFLLQRRRWASKTLVYDDWRIIVVLGFVLLFNLLPFVLLVAALFNKTYWIIFFFFFLAKTVIEWPFVSSVAAFFGEQKLMRHFFFVQPLHVFYTVFVGLLGQAGKYEWKGRRTR
ncbi:glycosyltransferase [Flavisolibacter ginsenosidimutans]|nr:glycosyltransferase [Flavisolibacter ginsenosidimutans]